MDTDFNYKKAVAFLQDKESAKKKQSDVLLNQALIDFDSIVKFIIGNYNPLRIYQWGSLLEREHFSEISDIDIGVEGIKSAQDFFSLYSDIENMTSFPVDLIQIEKIEPEFQEIIKLKGRVIYEKE